MIPQWLEILIQRVSGTSTTPNDTAGPPSRLSHPTPSSTLSLGEHNLPLALVKNRRARRYILRVRPDGTVRITVPRGGTIQEAVQFAERQKGWLLQQLQRLPERSSRTRPWLAGDLILYQGEWTKLEPLSTGSHTIIGLAEHRIPVRDGEANLRPATEAFLWRQARNRLAPRVWEWEAHCQHQGLATRRPLKRILVRNQRSRWGSCSARGTISLNWRLIQMPPFVQDYLILHELVHLREMNHSLRFWQQVARVCPTYATAESWIKKHAAQLG